MSIAFDTSIAGAANTKTWTHTVSGSNTLLVVEVYDGAANVTGCTYNGVAMTQAFQVTNANGVQMTVFYLINPATGANTVAVTMVSSVSMKGLSASYTGVKQSGQPDASNSGSNASAGANAAVAVTVVASSCWLLSFTTSTSNTPSAGRTQRQIGYLVPTSAYGLELADSNGTVGTGSQTTTHSDSGTVAANQLYGFDMSISPAVSAYSLVCDMGSFTYTGQSVSFSYGRTLSLAFGSYVLTGQSLLFSLFQKFTKEPLNTNSFSKEALSTNSFSKQGLPVNTFTKEPLP